MQETFTRVECGDNKYYLLTTLFEGGKNGFDLTVCNGKQIWRESGKSRILIAKHLSRGKIRRKMGIYEQLFFSVIVLPVSLHSLWTLKICVNSFIINISCKLGRRHLHCSSREKLWLIPVFQFHKVRLMI